MHRVAVEWNGGESIDQRTLHADRMTLDIDVHDTDVLVRCSEWCTEESEVRVCMVRYAAAADCTVPLSIRCTAAFESMATSAERMQAVESSEHRSDRGVIETGDVSSCSTKPARCDRR